MYNKYKNSNFNNDKHMNSKGAKHGFFFLQISCVASITTKQHKKDQNMIYGKIIEYFHILYSII